MDRGLTRSVVRSVAITERFQLLVATVEVALRIARRHGKSSSSKYELEAQ